MKETVAIMMTDIVGFTLMAKNNEDVLLEICEKHKNIHRNCINDYKGRLIHMFGDTSLSMFKDPVVAVKCAIEIQKLSRQEPVIPLRIAIHYGEVKREGDEVFGNAVNLTSRIVNSAIGNSILISDQVKPLMDKKHGIPCLSLGMYTFKYVDQPVEVFGISVGDLALPDALSKTKGEPKEQAAGFCQGKRLLAAIMFTDMVGYTALMQEDERKAKQNRDRHRNILQTYIKQHQGITLQYYGDGTLSIFHSSFEAINCAIDIQTKLQEEPKIPLRIGIHVADIMYDDEGIYGDGVNVASRIEGLAVAGSVLISGKAYDDIKNHPSVSTRSLGAYELKNVKKPIEVYAISNSSLIVPSKTQIRNQPSKKEKSLAILPFASFSSDAENEFFCDGISEAIINSLTQVEGLQVTARTSSFAFKGQNKDIRELGKILGVVYILEGSVQRHKNKIRVTAQLIDTLSGFHIFSEVYDRELMDVFSIQDDIAWLIAEKLKEKINLEEKQQLASPKTSNVRALEFYMQGVEQMNTGAHPDILQAMELFRHSFESDPDFVLPYTGICMCYTFLGAWGFIDEAESNLKSSEYALKALEKDPKHPKALVVHALSSFWNNNWDLLSFEAGIRKALKIAPGSSEVRLFNGMLMFIKGRVEDALIEMLLAQKLDPLNTNVNTRLGYAYLCLKEFDKARDWFRKAHETARLDLYFNFMIAWSFLIQDRYDEAESALDRVEEGKDGYQLKPGMSAYLHARQGRPEKAREKIRQIQDLGKEGTLKFPNLNLTLVYAGLEEREHMYDHLEKAFREKPISLMFIQADPFWEKYRHDERYISLIDRIFGKASTRSTT